MESNAKREISKWKLKNQTDTQNFGSNYFIIDELDWNANLMIKNRRHRLLHFMCHGFYIGDEKDQKFGRCNEMVRTGHRLLSLVFIPPQRWRWCGWIFCQKKNTHAKAYVLHFVGFSLSMYTIFFLLMFVVFVVLVFTEHAFHAAYYSTLYSEHFDPQAYPAKMLTMYHNGYEFIQQNERISMVCGFGYENGCKARVCLCAIFIQFVVNLQSSYNF